jgi:6,7-dimethyl-8-ribityllumazine synthase
MPKIIEGELLAGEEKLAIVVSRFNDFITTKLLDGALDTIRRHGGNADEVAVIWVPGSYELPVVAKKLAASGKYDAVVCLGCVIKGSTVHYDCVVSAATNGISRAATETGVPIIFGVLTCDSIEQAIERAGTKMGNAGAKAAGSAIEMASLMKKL